MATLLKWAVCSGGNHYQLVFDDGRAVSATRDELIAMASDPNAPIGIAEIVKGARTQEEVDTLLDPAKQEVITKEGGK